jgi:hypothetical protein
MFTSKLKKASTPPNTLRKSRPSSPQSSPLNNGVSSAIVPAPGISHIQSTSKAVAAASPTLLQAPESLRPHNHAEQYWAVRALKAETLLSARTVHHHELRSLSFSEETKRSVSTNII